MSDSESGRKRTLEIRIKLSPAMAAEFGHIAESFGMLPASLAAQVVGEYVEQRREKRRLTNLAIAASTKEMMDTGKLAQAFKQVFSDPEVLKAISQLDSSAGGQAWQAGSSAGPEAAAATSA